MVHKNDMIKALIFKLPIKTIHQFSHYKSVSGLQTVFSKYSVSKDSLQHKYMIPIWEGRKKSLSTVFGLQTPVYTHPY